MTEIATMNWQYVIQMDGDKVRYEILRNGIPTLISPEEISARILGKMKETAERKSGKTFENAVITVPGNVNPIFYLPIKSLFQRGSKARHQKCCIYCRYFSIST
jgi:hypothetical protein